MFNFVYSFNDYFSVAKSVLKVWHYLDDCDNYEKYLFLFGYLTFVNLAVIAASHVEEEDLLRHLEGKSLSPLCVLNQRRPSALKDVPHRCSVCSKKFWSPHILKNHIKNIHWKDSLSKNK